MEVLAECDEEKLTQLCRPMINAPANNESEYTSAQYNSGDWKSGGERETDRETETAEAERNRDREKWGGGKGGTSSIFSFFFHGENDNCISCRGVGGAVLQRGPGGLQKDPKRRLARQ